MEKLKISLPIIVEGRYDKSTLSGYVDAVIITTDGFGIFNNKEKQAMLRRICANGVILLTDSDGGGIQIRSFLQGIIPKDKIFNLYIPKIRGKEKRKTHASKAGLLGVEGMNRDTIEKLLSPFASGKIVKIDKKMTTKLDFFQDGLSGGDNSSALRAKLCEALSLPSDMTAKALLEAVNLLIDREEYKRLVLQIKNKSDI